MSNDNQNMWGLAGNRALPGLTSQNNYTALRTSHRGELLVSVLGKPRNVACDEGQYFVATNPTPGTGIAGIAATGAFSDAESLLLVRNDASVSSGKRIYLDRLRLTVTAAGTNGTDHRYVSKVDTGTTRYTSGGSAITPVNPNMASSEASAATIKFGALVTTAASASARLVGNGSIRNVITVAGDVYEFDFGGNPVGASLAVAGTAVGRFVIPHAPVVLGPTDMFILSLHAASQDGASSYEFELTYLER